MTVSFPFAVFLLNSTAFTVSDVSCDKDTDTARCIGSLWINSNFQIDIFLPNDCPMDGFILNWNDDTLNNTGMADREKETVDEALEYNWILKERGEVNYPDDIIVNAFVEGTKWTEKNPSEETIDKIIDLLYEANKEVRLHVVNPDGISLNEARKMQIKYIKEHFND